MAAVALSIGYSNPLRILGLPQNGIEFMLTEIIIERAHAHRKEQMEAQAHLIAARVAEMFNGRGS